MPAVFVHGNPETAALWRQTDTANRLVRNELTGFLYQLQFATFETVPQFLASSDDYDTLAPFFGRLRANALQLWMWGKILVFGWGWNPLQRKE